MAEDVLRTRSLAQALAKLVFAHAAVHEAYASAKSRALKEGTYAQLDEYASLIGTFYGHDEPLLALRYFAGDSYDLRPSWVGPDEPAEDPQVAKYFDADEPEEVGNYYEMVVLRAETLIEVLHSGQVLAVGHTVDGRSVQIQCAIWRHPSFYVDPETGDIFDADTYPMTRVWTGISFVPGAVPQPNVSREADQDASSTFAAQPTTSGKAVKRVMTKTRSSKECRAWLKGIFLRSPDVITDTNAELWVAAQRKWPGTLSKEAFKAERRQAIEEAKTPAWGAAGARTKTARQNRGPL